MLAGVALMSEGRLSKETCQFRFISNIILKIEINSEFGNFNILHWFKPVGIKKFGDMGSFTMSG